METCAMALHQQVRTTEKDRPCGNYCFSPSHFCCWLLLRVNKSRNMQRNLSTLRAEDETGRRNRRSTSRNVGITGGLVAQGLLTTRPRV